MKKIKYLIVAVIFFSLLFTKDAFAFQKTKTDMVPQNDFVVEPGKTEIFLDPGESTVKNIVVTNRINKKVKFRLTTEDFVGTDDPNQPVVLLGDEYSPFSLKDFIKPEVTEFELELGERIIIPVTVSVPLDAEPRGYYGALIISNDPEKLEEGASKETEGKARVISRIGSLFLLRINGEGKEEGKVQNFKAIGPEKSFYTQRPEGFEISYQNTGNVHLVPYGVISIKNIFGKVIQTLPVDAYFVLPDSIRHREIKWSEGFSIGRYTASLSLNKGYNNEYENIDLAFWVLPWKIMLIAFAVIVFLTALIYYFLTRFELKRKE